MLYRRLQCIVMFVFLILFLSSCGNHGILLEHINETEKGDRNIVTREEKIKNPLTGLYMDKKYKNQRPIAVMIENEYHSRPQSGLEEACIVYEALAEGGITRFLAIYIDNDVTEIGPIRSSRPYFIDYALEYDSIYVHYGASPRAYNDLKQLSIDTIDGIYDSITFWRDKSRKSPHNAYTNTERILNMAKKHNFFKPVYIEPIKFSNSKERFVGINVDEFSLDYFNNYRIHYRYDSEKMSYQRLMNDAPHIDRTTGNPIYVKNIIVQFNDTKVIDNEGRLAIKTIGKGSGYYICEGVLQKIQWEKSSRDSRTKYFYDDGRKLEIKPGNTWIQVMPKKSRLDIKK